jgi:glucuronate isomerase
MTTSAPFLSEDFLLSTGQARELYHGYAKEWPIIDYHCHLLPEEIARDRRFENLTQIWLHGDHYKWRAMRTAGVAERFITGDASDWEKFEQWAATVPKTLRNPLYHWTHLELRNPFGIHDRLLSPSTAKGIWDECNAKLSLPAFSTRGILQQMNVEVICTTDDPVDSLEHHAAMRKDPALRCRVLPTFRPDRALSVESPERFLSYVHQLAQAADVEIRTLPDFFAALRKRHSYFHQHGCRLSDHGLETVYVEEYTDREIRAAFDHVLAGMVLKPGEILKFKSAVLYELAVMDWEKGWTQQYHFGPLRNTNSRMLRTIGPDSGFDTIGEFEIGRPLARFLDRLDNEDHLANTIIYNLNPRDNELLAAMIGNFQDGKTPGKIQYGSAWWFLDQMDGMRRQMDALSNMGLLSLFVGMVTDSRSLLSYPRHEYFRRLLCSMLGDEMNRGLLPGDMELVGKMVSDISYHNAKRYFGFGAD